MGIGDRLSEVEWRMDAPRRHGEAGPERSVNRRTSELGGRALSFGMTAAGDAVTKLPLPPHFDPDRVAHVWRVDYEQRAAQARAWAVDHGIPPAAADSPRICLLLVDCQNTFCIPGHELFVGGRSGSGAVDDTRRLAQFIYRHLATITEIVVTLDTHSTAQVFHPSFWINQAGEHPVGGQTVITPDDIATGAWRPNPQLVPGVAGRDGAWLERYAAHYVRRLAEGRYALMVWPYHALLGSIGHALVSSIEEAVFFHAMARATAARFEIKGDHPLTENYSVLRPEVLDDHEGMPIAAPNVKLIEHMLKFDRVFVAGQAKSHCVAWTCHDLLDAISGRDPGLAGRVTLLDDCSSPVVIPGVVDFTDQAEEAYARFAKAGMRRALSTDL